MIVVGTGVEALVDISKTHMDARVLGLSMHMENYDSVCHLISSPFCVVQVYVIHSLYY